MSSIHGDSVEEIQLETEERMDKTVDDLRREMATIRTGRASVHLLDSVRADYYGTPTPLNQMANLSTPEASSLVIQPWDASSIGAIEKAIMNANLGVNPQNDGRLIRINIPPLNEERRREFVRQLHQMTENHRIAVRNLRRDANDSIKKLEKDKVISEDIARDAQGDIQTITDATIAKLDSAGASKEKEIMEIG
jgi:ribosome recycling factor